MIDLNLNPNRRELRQFSVALLVASGLVGGLLWWKMGPNPWSRALWIGGPILSVLGLAIPPAIKPLFLGLSILAFPIGIVVGTVAMMLVYYGIVTPIALVFKLLGRDTLTRSFDRDAPTYWVKRQTDIPGKRYFQQF